MLKYVAVTLMALVGLGLTVGDEANRQEVSRASTDGLLDLNFSGFVSGGDVEVQTLETLPGTISERDAVAEALAAAKAHRATREVRVTLRGAAPTPTIQPEATVQTASATVAVEPAAEPAMWYVTGSRVNIRSGPSTSDAVVTQAVFGDEAVPLTDTASDWIEIEMVDGTTGWIFSRFLSDSQPG